MGEYIKREAVLKKLEQEGCDCEFMRTLLDFPTADVALVVRCKDCKSGEMCSIREAGNFGETGFCVVGKQKDGDG